MTGGLREASGMGSALLVSGGYEADVVSDAPDAFVRVRGASEHNLRHVDVDIPRDAMVAFTGVSGSGKSSLALGTLYAEAQRRYFESVAPYAGDQGDRGGERLRYHSGGFHPRPVAAAEQLGPLGGVLQAGRLRAGDAGLAQRP